MGAVGNNRKSIGSVMGQDGGRWVTVSDYERISKNSSRATIHQFYSSLSFAEHNVVASPRFMELAAFE